MRVPEFWLRSWIDTTLSIEEIADALTMAGLEVEELEAAAPPFTGVVLAKIESAEKHPDADRLRVCRVNAGPGAESLQIICGAPNARAGIYVACAREGAVLPGEFKIKRAKMRGVESQGMLCSFKELGISEESDGIIEVSPSATDLLGANLREVLQLDQKTLVLKLTPNRPDCLSVFGIARELSAVIGAPLKSPEPLTHGHLARVAADIAHPARLAETALGLCPVTSSARYPIHLRPETHPNAQPLCGRFSSRVIEGVNAGAKTPEFIRQRLEAAGQRCISVLVDLSNYVMLEFGRPSHIFDLDALKPVVDGGIEVRWARDAETFELLNGQSPVLNTYYGVIADAQGPVALAGIMGGQRSAVSDATQNILIEAAFWWPDAVRGRSQQLKFSTDAGHRFERGVSAATTVAHIEVLSALILQICGGKAGPMQDEILGVPQRPEVSMRRSRCVRVMGRDYSVQQISEVFQRLQLPFSHQASLGDDVFRVTPPPERFDIEIEEDLIEEVARIVGFDAIEVRSPTAPLVPRIAPESDRPAHALRKSVAFQDYHEVVTYSFIDPSMASGFAQPDQQIHLVNPIASQLSLMRPSLLPSLVKVLQDNLARQEQRVRIFELGRVFLSSTDVTDGPASVAGIDQPIRLGALAYGPVCAEQWGQPSRDVDFFDVKADLEAIVSPLAITCQPPSVSDQSLSFLHPGQSCYIFIDGQRVGWLGALHPSLQQQWQISRPVLAFEIDLLKIRSLPLPQPQAPSRFPTVIRDLAFVVDSRLPSGRISETINSVKNINKQLFILKNFVCFDEYKGQGLASNEKSLAFRLSFQDTERTLEESDIEAAISIIVRAVEQGCKAALRSAA